MVRACWAYPVLAAIAVTVTAMCGGASDGGRPSVVAEFKDFAIALDRASVGPGRTAVGVRNTAAQEHMLVVLRTDLALDRLPIDDKTLKAKEDGKVGEIASIPGGRSASVTLDLAPGHYVLLCNIPEHYAAGMYVALIVQ